MVETDLNENYYSLGKALILERKKKNIPLEEISKTTNITLKSLKALENEEFHRLPGEFYLKNYIKSYLMAVGCDEKTFFQVHKEALQTLRLGANLKKTTYYSKLRYSRFKKKNVFFSGFIFLLVFGAAFLFLFLRKTTIPRPSLRVQEASIPFAPFTKANDFSIDYQPVRVVVEFLESCWIRVRRGQQQNQQNIIEQVYQKGDRLEIKGYELHFFIGNPSAVRLYLNNQEVEIFKNTSQAKKIILTPVKVNEILEKCKN